MSTYRHEELLLRLHPIREDLDLSDGTTARAELVAWGTVLDGIWDQRDALMVEILPDTTTDTLTSWERVYDLHPPAGVSTSQRRDRVRAARRRLPDMRPTTIDELLELALGTEVSLYEPGSFRCDDEFSLTDWWEDPIDGQFTFIVEVDEATIGDFTTRDEMEAYLEILKPAHVYGAVQTNLFLTDDPWSLTDHDLIEE